MTPHEAAVKCLEYAKWRRLALAALAPDQPQDYRFDKPFRLKDSDIRDAQERCQQLLDIIASEARQAGWFSEQQYTRLYSDILNYIRQNSPVTTIELIKAFNSTRRRVNTVLADLKASGLLESHYVSNDNNGRIHYVWRSTQ